MRMNFREMLLAQKLFGGSGGSGGSGWDGVYERQGAISFGDYFFEGDKTVRKVFVTHYYMYSDGHYVGRRAFASTENLEKVCLDYYRNADSGSTLRIKESAFSLSAVKDVYLHAGRISVGTEAFYRCENLENLSISANSIDIDGRAFEGCSNLKNVNALQANYVGPYAFQDCVSLEKIEFGGEPDIKEGAFCGCSNLRALIIRTTGCELDVTSVLGSGIVTEDGVPTGGGFIYVLSSRFDYYVANLTEQATALTGDAATAEYIIRAILRKIQDYPEICG